MNIASNHITESHPVTDEVSGYFVLIFFIVVVVAGILLWMKAHRDDRRNAKAIMDFRRKMILLDAMSEGSRGLLRISKDVASVQFVIEYRTMMLKEIYNDLPEDELQAMIDEDTRIMQHLLPRIPTP